MMFSLRNNCLLPVCERSSRLVPLFALITFIPLLFASEVVSRTWYIKADGSGDAPTIQAGVDSAAAGDTVMVHPGTYSDTVGVLVKGWNMIANVHVSKSVSIIGEDEGRSATIDGTNSHISIFVEGASGPVVIKHLSMTRHYPSGGGCILDTDVQEPIQSFNTFGVRCQGGLLFLEHNSIYDIKGAAVYLEGVEADIIGNDVDGAGQGVSCSASRVKVINNNFLRCVGPINGRSSRMIVIGNFVEGGEGHDSCGGFSFATCTVWVRGNRIQGPKFEGISCHAGTDAVIENNRINARDTGLYLAGGDSTTVRGNVFYGCSFAIDVLAANHALIENNTFDAPGIGVMCQVGMNPIIRNNIIVRGGVGVFCDVGSTPVIECNDLFQLTLPYYGCGDQPGLNGNMSVDPEFCGVDDSGNYFLQSDSPCAPGNHPGGYACGLIGALGVNCGEVETERRSWGGLKNIYR